MAAALPSHAEAVLYTLARGFHLTDETASLTLTKHDDRTRSIQVKVGEHACTFRQQHGTIEVRQDAPGAPSLIAFWYVTPNPEMDRKAAEFMKRFCDQRSASAGFVPAFTSTLDQRAAEGAALPGTSPDPDQERVLILQKHWAKASGQFGLGSVADLTAFMDDYLSAGSRLEAAVAPK
jgi:hypothetical protein